MIFIALIVPAIGGMVEVVLSIAAVTAGPLLAPAIWALYSKRLSGAAAFWISIGTLAINIVFKLILPWTIRFKLNRAEEMVVGVGLPLLLLIVYELIHQLRNSSCDDYSRYTAARAAANSVDAGVDVREAYAIRKQNHFGLRVIAFSLLFTAAMLLGLSLVADAGGRLTAVIAVVVLAAATIPMIAARRSKQQLMLEEQKLRALEQPEIPTTITV